MFAEVVAALDALPRAGAPRKLAVRVHVDGKRLANGKVTAR